MADQVAAIHTEGEIQHQHTVEAIFGGTLVGGLVAAGAAAVAIIGLSGMFPQILLSVATIGIGAAFLFEGAAIMTRLSDLLHEVSGGALQSTELGGGTTAETMAGIAGVALGILSLLGVLPGILVPVAAIVFGGALTVGAGANMRINELTSTYRQEHPMARQIAHEAVRGATGLQVLAGLGSITLGIVALAGTAPLVLSLVAMLGVAAVFLLTDTAVAGRMMTVFHH